MFVRCVFPITHAQAHTPITVNSLNRNAPVRPEFLQVLVPYEKPKHPFYHHDHHHDHHITHDYNTDYTNTKYQQVSATQQPSAEQTSSQSAEYQEYLPRPEYLRATAAALQEQTKLFQASAMPYEQQQQQYNHHQMQQQYSQMRRDLLTHERLNSGSEESESESNEFRPFNSQSAEASSNVETVVPPPPNHLKRSQFHINVPESTEQPDSVQGGAAASTNNQFTHNIEIPVHFYRLQPLESGEGFAISP